MAVTIRFSCRLSSHGEDHREKKGLDGGRGSGAKEQNEKRH